MPRYLQERFLFGTLAVVFCFIWGSARPSSILARENQIIHTITGKVVSVADGDTITVLEGRTQHRVRLYGIDAPERSQAFGARAKEFVSRLAFDQTVRLLVRGTDRYGRIIAEALLADGQSLNQEMVRTGFAWWFKRYAPNDCALEKLEREARTAKVGLWADLAPTPPWEYRRR